MEYSKGDKVKVMHEGLVYSGTIIDMAKMFKWQHIHVEMQKGVGFWKFPEDIIERTGRHYANSAEVEEDVHQVEDEIAIDDILEEAEQKRAAEKRAKRDAKKVAIPRRTEEAPVAETPVVSVNAPTVAPTEAAAKETTTGAPRENRAGSTAWARLEKESKDASDEENRAAQTARVRADQADAEPSIDDADPKN